MSLHKHACRILLFLIVILQTSFSFAAEAPPSGANPDDVDFHWAFAALEAADGKATVQPVTRGHRS